MGFTWGVVRHKRGRSYYGADERLRYFQERDLRGGTTPKEDGVWEEYRYDPLGRRVMVNARTQGLCNTGTAFQCASATTRMVWASDQLLWEIRGPSESPGETAGPSDAYGTVGYAHAGGIDRPLVITKNGVSVLPHQNWRGQFSRGTWVDGHASDCPNSWATNCVNIPWPGWRTTAWHAEVKERDIRAWWGGLVDGMRDASGQMYMRNRYYDPATGQFTQQDPIGLAGGLNSYGFAAGDPVSYSDPYGLSAESDSTKVERDKSTSKRYGRCEVAGILNNMIRDLRSNPSSFFPQYPPAYDFRAEDEADHGEDNLRNYYEVGGQWLRSDQFGNFAAGYAGARAFRGFGWAAMRAGGILYSTLFGEGNEDPLDLASRPMINAGANRATLDMYGQPGHLANWGAPSGPRPPQLTSTAGCTR